MSTSCPRCGEAASGKFCANCGSALKGAECPDCNGALTPGAQFCHHCGAALKSAAPAAPSRVPWVVTGVALVAVIALVLFQASRAATDAGPADTGQGAPMGGSPMGGAPSGGMPSAADIAAMSPQEQADRLFNRVMMYSSEGKADSAAIFAPMALQAFDMIAPLDVHQRYDVGLVAMVAGQLGRAKVEADTILSKNRNDLLGLTLAMRVAEASKNTASAGDFAKRLIAAEPAERKSSREEYQFHSNDIEAALKDARERKP
ncbi:MAG: zinc ribbon domain-containing protein [Gemmatimonadaceae bacterium]|nr:zinc ribbon domain-containing protein [Gemmatimonadaceae bacterium]